MQIIKKLFCSHVSVNKGLIQHVVQRCYNYNITFQKLEIHTVKMRPISACYTSGRGNSLNRALFELRPLHYLVSRLPRKTLAKRGKRNILLPSSEAKLPQRESNPVRTTRSPVQRSNPSGHRAPLWKIKCILFLLNMSCLVV